MNMKPIYLINLFITFIFLISCNNQPKLKFGLLLPNITDERFPKDEKYFKMKAFELGAEVISMEADNSSSVQYNQALELINMGISVLIIVPVNTYSAATIVRKAHDQNIKVIAYERMISNASPDFYITYDHFAAGELMAQYASKKIPMGNYVMIAGDKSDLNAQKIYNGMMSVLNPLIKENNIHIVYTQYTEDWSSDAAEIAIENVMNMTMTPINAVMVANDGMAGGVRKALNNNGMHDVLITGLDADLEACKRIVNGEQSMTIYKGIKYQAFMAAEIAYSLATNKLINIPFSSFDNGNAKIPSIFMKPIAVDSANLFEVIVGDDVYQKKDLLVQK